MTRYRTELAELAVPTPVFGKPMQLSLEGAHDLPHIWTALRDLLDELAKPGRRATITVEVSAEATEHHPQPVPAPISSVVRLPDLRKLNLLTPAERALTLQVYQGLSNGEIAFHLGKSIRTVKSQLTSIYRKLGVRSRTRLLALLR